MQHRQSKQVQTRRHVATEHSVGPLHRWGKKKGDARGVCTCAACVHLCPCGAGEDGAAEGAAGRTRVGERGTQIVKGLASVLKVLEEIHTRPSQGKPK